MSQVDRVARYLSGQSAHTMCERSWIRVPVGPCAFSSPVTFAGQCVCVGGGLGGGLRACAFSSPVTFGGQCVCVWVGGWGGGLRAAKQMSQGRKKHMA